MGLNFGKVVKYFENGFGFIQPLENQSCLKKNEIFFHITKVKQYKSELEAFRLDNSKGVYFWFNTAQGKKGQEVSEAWLKVEGIPSGFICEFLSELAGRLIKNNALIKTAELKNKPVDFQSSISKFSAVSPSKPNIQLLCEKYRLEPTGIRNDKNMRHVCLDCGTDNTEYKKLERDQYKPISSFTPTQYSMSAEGFHRCCNCDSKWYINYCWSCHSGRVDDRDPKTPRCSECSWCKCERCSSCSYYGCETNDFSKDHKYIDNIEKEF